MDNLSLYLSSYGIRPSVQRIAIMKYLIENRTHPTVDEVFEQLRTQIPTLSKTTIYNTLKLFVENGAATFVGIEEKYARFDGDTSPHAHFLCKKCGDITDLSVIPRDFLPARFNGKVDEVHFYIKGLCENCINTKSAI